MKTAVKILSVFVWLAFMNLVVDGVKKGSLSFSRLLGWLMLASLAITFLALGCTTNNYSTVVEDGDDDGFAGASPLASANRPSSGGSSAIQATSTPEVAGSNSVAGGTSSVPDSTVASVAGSTSVSGGSTCVWIPFAGSTSAGGASSLAGASSVVSLPSGGARAVSSSSVDRPASYPACLSSGTCGACSAIEGEDSQCDTYQRCFIVQKCSPLSSCATERQVSVNGILQGQCSVVGVKMDCRCAL